MRYYYTKRLVKKIQKAVPKPIVVQSDNPTAIWLSKPNCSEKCRIEMRQEGINAPLWTAFIERANGYYFQSRQWRTEQAFLSDMARL